MILRVLYDGKRLEIQAESPAEAFVLGEVWGKYQDNSNIGLYGCSTLSFDLAPLDKKPGDKPNKELDV